VEGGEQDGFCEVELENETHGRGPLEDTRATAAAALGWELSDGIPDARAAVVLSRPCRQCQLVAGLFVYVTGVIVPVSTNGIGIPSTCPLTAVAWPLKSVGVDRNCACTSRLASPGASVTSAARATRTLQR